MRERSVISTKVTTNYTLPTSLLAIEKYKMMLLSNTITITLLLLSFPYLFGAFKVLPTGKVLTSSKLFLFGNPEPSKDAAPAKKDGGLFGMGNMMENMKKAQEIAKQAEVLNKELAQTAIVGQDPSGQVVATFTALGTPISIKLSDAVLAQGSEAASIAASQAMLDAHGKATNVMISRMQALYSASGFPNMPGGK